MLSHGVSKCLGETLAGTASSCPVEHTGCICPVFGTPEFTAQTAQVSFCPENKTRHSCTPSYRQLLAACTMEKLRHECKPMVMSVDCRCSDNLPQLPFLSGIHSSELSREKRDFLSVKSSGLFPSNGIESSLLSCHNRPLNFLFSPLCCTLSHMTSSVQNINQNGTYPSGELNWDNT